jgi:type II secretory pathway pseudopilin PulG
MMRARRREGGMALLLVMVLMFVIAWFAATTFRMSNQEMQVVGNRQAQQRATAAAQRAIEQTISSNMFTRDPAAVAATPITSDVDGDGTDDLTAMLTPIPSCIRMRPIKTLELDVAKPADRVCLQSSAQLPNLIVVPGAPVVAGNSLCSQTEWNVSAAVNDAQTSTSVAVSQGVSIRVEAANANSYCS